MSDRRFITAILLAGLGAAGLSVVGFVALRDNEPRIVLRLIPNSTKIARVDPEFHERTSREIRRRLFSAHRSLAYAESGKWSLATWAQLQWVRRTLDGEAMEDSESRADSDLRDFGFERLLNELVGSANSRQSAAAESARRDGMDVVTRLAAMRPSTDKPFETLKYAESRIELSEGLRPFVAGLPHYDESSFSRD